MVFRRVVVAQDVYLLILRKLLLAGKPLNFFALRLYIFNAQVIISNMNVTIFLTHDDTRLTCNQNLVGNVFVDNNSIVYTNERTEDCNNTRLVNHLRIICNVIFMQDDSELCFTKLDHLHCPIDKNYLFWGGHSGTRFIFIINDVNPTFYSLS